MAAKLVFALVLIALSTVHAKEPAKPLVGLVAPVEAPRVKREAPEVDIDESQYADYEGDYTYNDEDDEDLDVGELNMGEDGDDFYEYEEVEEAEPEPEPYVEFDEGVAKETCSAEDGDHQAAETAAAAATAAPIRN